jgi:hypothetical protein
VALVVVHVAVRRLRAVRHRFPSPATSGPSMPRPASPA